MPVGHLNWSYLRAPWGNPAVAEFCDAVARINRAAESARGYLWRAELGPRDIMRLGALVRETGGAPFDPERVAVTLSMWETADALKAFVHGRAHGRFLDRRSEWFVPQGTANYVIWPIVGDRRPTAGQADARMRQLIDEGPSPEAYDFKWISEEAA